MKSFAVVILNWNGWKDTNECLNSIKTSDKYAVPIVVDNGSTDDSLAEIRREMRILYGDYIECSSDSNYLSNISSNVYGVPVLLIENENHGFAGGCNRGLNIATRVGYDKTVFINNDTIVENGSLSNLVERIRMDEKIFVTLPLLTVQKTGRIWNCGGVLSDFGFRRYYYAGVDYSNTIIPKEIICTFFTGCCFAIDTFEFSARGGFTERYFFGEEDFELSFWMKDRGLRALCLTGSIVHHKVGGSISRNPETLDISKCFVHYLNRFIHMKLRFGKILWFFWAAAYIPYVALVIYKIGVTNILLIYKFIRALISRAYASDEVSRQDFLYILNGGKW